MIKRGIILFIGILNILTLLCCDKNHNSSRTINSSSPAGNAHLKISFKKILEIHEDWFDYGLLFMDTEGNIIYWQGRDGTVSIFDPEGKRLLLKKIQSGQGYGDLMFFDFEDGGDQYLVYDKSNDRLNHYSKEFDILKSAQIRSDTSLFIFRLDERRNRYFIFDSMEADKSGWNQEVGVARYGTYGKQKMVFFQIKYRIFDFIEKRMIGYFYGSPFLRYIVDHEGALWICDRREYKIYKYDSSGHLEKLIEKKHEKIPLRGETEKKFRSYYRLDKLELEAGSPNLKYEEITPAYANPIMDILLLENHLLVLTMSNQWKSEKKGKIAVDVFDREGRFIQKLEIPEFYNCYSLTNQFKSAICYKNGRLAALESDEDMEKFWISLYQPQYKETND